MPTADRATALPEAALERRVATFGDATPSLDSLPRAENLKAPARPYASAPGRIARSPRDEYGARHTWIHTWANA